MAHEQRLSLSTQPLIERLPVEFVTLVVLLVIGLALFFDFTNGFHDTANAMATPIATGALTPKFAVGLAAVLNFVGAFLSTEVARTISGGLIYEDKITDDIFPVLILAGLVGAIVWNMLTWFLGLPSSSSHALFGGLIGAVIVGMGIAGINIGVLLSRVILPAVLAPFTAGIIAFVVTKIAYATTRRYDKKPSGRDGFRWGQIMTSSLVALAHGTNDAQKTMGVITLALITVGWQPASHPDPYFWVIFACAFTIGLGTYMGGWRIIRTLGQGLTQVRPAQGFSAESSTAATILASSAVGFALSTTQVASGSVIGSGLGRRGSTVRWSMVTKIVSGWLLTLPAAALVGGLSALLVVKFQVAGVILNVIFVLAVTLGLFLFSRMNKVDHETAISTNVSKSSEAVDINVNPEPTPRQARKAAERKAAKEARKAKEAEQAAMKQER